MSFVVKIRSLVLFSLVIMGATLMFMGYQDYYQTKETFNTTEVSPDQTNVTIEPAAGNADETKKIDRLLQESPQINAKSGKEFFIDYRLQRDRIRDQQVDLLREMINNPNSSPDVRKTAQQQLMSIIGNLTREVELENLIMAKGFENTAVFIQPSSVTVIVGTNNLTDQDRIKISDLVTRTIGHTLENIIIMSKS